MHKRHLHAHTHTHEAVQHLLHEHSTIQQRVDNTHCSMCVASLSWQYLFNAGERMIKVEPVVNGSSAHICCESNEVRIRRGLQGMHLQP